MLGKEAAEGRVSLGGVSLGGRISVSPGRWERKGVPAISGSDFPRAALIILRALRNFLLFLVFHPQLHLKWKCKISQGARSAQPLIGGKVVM